MPDDLIENTTTVPAGDSPPPIEPVDENGVPWKNRVAEWQRKTEEAEARAKENADLVAQYKVVLGQQRTNPPPTERAAINRSLDEMEKTFPPETQEYLRALRTWVQEEAKKTSEQTGYGLMTDVSHTTALQQDAELLEETKRQMAMLNNHPLWAAAD